MANISPNLGLANQVITQCRNKGIIQLTLDGPNQSVKSFNKGRKNKTSFSSCSYLALEKDARLKKAAIEAIEQYGVQFSSSRAFIQLPLYEEAESLLAEIFGMPTIISPTTTLGHLSAIPILVNKNDAIITDHQVHASVQNAVGVVKGSGVYTEAIRHNRMDILESRIKKLHTKFEKIWYMADGVYSMFGDSAPLNDIYELMNMYENFHCYIDDAHGMSWSGLNGSGFTLNRIPLHHKMFMATSLNKGFGAAGGALISPNQTYKELIRNIGPTLMFSGPVQPPCLGAVIASAKIHLSDEIHKKQAVLKDLIRYFVITAKGLQLPLVNEEKTPIFFIGVGAPEIGYEICKRMLDDGFFVNIAVYPAVPFKNTGIRLTLNVDHTYQDINEMLTALAFHLENLEKSKQISKQEIFKAFSLAY